MLPEEDPVQSPSPVLESLLTPSDIQELLSIFQSEDPASPNSGSQGSSNRAVYSIDERKSRRKISNRESARRSRWRKKWHLDNLKNQVNRLKIENRELKTRLAMAMHQNILVSTENDRLNSESLTLLARLSNLYRFSCCHQQALSH